MTLRIAKTLLLLLFLLADFPNISTRVSSLGLSFSLLLYIGLYVPLAVGLFAAAFIPSPWIRLPLAVLLTASSLVLLTYEAVTKGPFDYHGFETMLASAGAATSAMAVYGNILVRTVPVTLLLFVAILLPVRSNGLTLRHGLGAPVAALGLLSLMFYYRGGEGGRALPAPFAPIAYTMLKGVTTLSDIGQVRRTVSIKPDNVPSDQDLVLIVDESIAPTYLDINNPDGVYSGLNRAPGNLAIHNFGYAASVSNCSAGTNNTLRFGGTRDNYRLAKRRYPSVWAYAHRAGFHTVYLDAQRVDGVLHNRMTEEEKGHVDEFVQFGAFAVLDRDQALADELLAKLKNGRRDLIYINKLGAHFPVADKFPDSMARYQPILPRGHTADIADMGSVHGDHDGSPEFWRLYRNAYRNTLLWNVGHFWDKIFANIGSARPIIVYTSDHGQELHEDNWPGRTTHCIGNPRPQEGLVPIVVIDATDKPRTDWAHWAALNHNRTSHFRIYPTLLTLMGYKQSDIAPVYGPSLVEPASEPLMFNISYFAALGKKPDWRRIHLEDVPMPPHDGTGALAGARKPTGARNPTAKPQIAAR